MVGSSEDDDVKAAKAASLATAGGAGGGSSAHSSPRSKARLGQETGGETTGDDYEDDDDDSASGGSDEEDYNRTEGKAKGSSDAGAKRALSDPKKYQHHRREKRLAMNRESARARRKRKKLLIETLEEQVASLTDQNRRLSTTAETLLARIRHLESELALTSALGRPALPDASTHAMGPWTRDIGSIEASLLGTLPPAQQRQQPSSLLLEPIRAAQLRAEELHHAHRRAGLDMLAFHQGSGTAGGMDARLWEALPFRSQFLGDYQQHVGIMPTSMFTPSLQNTLASPLDLGIRPGRVSDPYSSSNHAARPARGTLQSLPDARAPSSVLSGSSSQLAPPLQSIDEILKRQHQQLQRRRGGDSGGDKFPPNP